MAPQVSMMGGGQTVRKPHLWAHRGAGKTAPENTLRAIREGASRGFRAVEFDTMPTADGVWILHHDWTTGRTLQPMSLLETASGLNDGTSQAYPETGTRIVHLTAAELAGYEAGRWLSPQFAGEPIPLLSDALNLCAQLGLEVNVELKLDMDSGWFTPERLEQTVQSLLAVLTAGGVATDRLVVSSFGLPGLYALRRMGYEGRMAPLFEVLTDEWIVHARALGAEAVHTEHTQATAEWVRRVHTTGRAFRVYTVNAPSRLAELAAMGVDDCFTDHMGMVADST